MEKVKYVTANSGSFFGHLRTFKETYNSFFEKVFIPNQEDGFLIDIFMHTWDEYDAATPTWSHTENLSIRGVKVSKEDIEFANQVYHPKKFLIETMNVENGRELSVNAVNKLSKEYAEEKKIKYDFFFYCRPDVLFVTPLRIKMFLDLYQDPEFSYAPLPKEYAFLANSAFNRLPVMDHRHIPEFDIIWFASVHCAMYAGNLLRIPFNYILFRDFTLKRSNSIPPEKSNPCSSERSNPDSSKESSPPPYDKKKKYMLSRWITTACLPFKKLRSRWR